MFDEALLLPPEEVDYGSFDERRLLGLAIQEDEPYIATNALSELRTRNAAEAQTAAREILARPTADRHLRALAITTLFDTDVAGSIPALTDAVRSTEDPKVLGSMIEGVLGDLASFTSPAGARFIELLLERVRAVRPDEFCDGAEWSKFLAHFDPRSEP